MGRCWTAHLTCTLPTFLSTAYLGFGRTETWGTLNFEARGGGEGTTTCPTSQGFKGEPKLNTNDLTCRPSGGVGPRR